MPPKNPPHDALRAAVTGRIAAGLAEPICEVPAPYTEFEIMQLERVAQGQPPVGPLTRAQHEDELAYAQYMAESLAEYEARDAAGGRTICDRCGERKMVWRSVCTLGYPGHPGAEMSEYGKCENCGQEEL